MDEQTLVLVCKVLWGLYVVLETTVLSAVFGWMEVVDSLGSYLYSFLIDQFPVLRYDVKGKHVLVTGCSSGFGLDLVIDLAKRGCFVYANVRSKQGAEELQKSVDAAGLKSNVTVFVFDVVDERGVIECKEKIDKILDGKSLWAVVNNAGVFTEQFAEAMSMEEFRRIIEVNLVATVSVCRVFLPLLRRNLKQPGRIINISSTAGRIADIRFAAYAASKFGLEGFSDSLRRELITFGVDVIILEPGFFKTKMVVNANAVTDKELLEKIPAGLRNDYRVLSARKNTLVDPFRYKYVEDPSSAVKDISRSVYARWPRTRAWVGLQAWFMMRFGAAFPSRFMDWYMYLGFR
jgi:NAD(P)-dependent dehydrogenase (short-subunit alcohol dehydrogenase family)